MCSSGVIGGVLGLVGGGIQAQGQVEQGRAESTRLSSEAQIAENNAALAAQDVELTQEGAEFSKADVDLDVAQLRGAAKTSFAAGNVLLEDGSAREFDLAAVEQAARDKGAIQQQADLQKAKFANERKSLLYEARQLRSASKRVGRASKMSALGTFLGSAGNAAGQFSSMRSSRRSGPGATQRVSSREARGIGDFNIRGGGGGSYA